MNKPLNAAPTWFVLVLILTALCVAGAFIYQQLKEVRVELTRLADRMARLERAWPSDSKSETDPALREETAPEMRGPPAKRPRVESMEERTLTHAEHPPRKTTEMTTRKTALQPTSEPPAKIQIREEKLKSFKNPPEMPSLAEKTEILPLSKKPDLKG